MSDDVRDVHRYWETLARHDPLWAVLSDPTRKGRKWDLPSFLETGRREISTLFYELEDLKIAVDRRRALDFGCGVGRATQALAEHFDQVVGVDISETMVRLAGRLNRHGGRVRYVLNQTGDLKVFPDAEFSFVYSNIVLQHIPPPAAWKYLEEFWRILAPGGLLIFQLPSHLKEDLNPAVVIRAMPEEAYRAEITLASPPPAPVAVSGAVVLDVVVRNAGGHDWSPPAEAPIRLGNHWLDGAGTTMLIQDDGRAFLPPSVAAGGECRLSLAMTAPAREGDYTVELDLVHESISWFKDKGSAALRFPVEVRAGLGTPPPKPPAAAPAAGPARDAASAPATDIYDELPDDSEDPGIMPMHGIPSADVLAFLEGRGADVLYLEKDESCGREWIGYRYFVRKPRPACADSRSAAALNTRFRLTSYLRFTALLLAFGFAAAAGMTRAGLTPLLLLWAGFVVVAFFFPGWGIRVLCTHCPFYARPGFILRCNSTIGPLKLWRPRPGPASAAERLQFKVILWLVLGSPLVILLFAGQFLWAGLTAAAAALLAWTETTFACRRCVNFACFLNRVPAGMRNAFLDGNPALKKAWAKNRDM